MEELYGVEVSPTLISTITDAVLEDVRSWQSRPVDAVYPILYFDCLFVKSRQEGRKTSSGSGSATPKAPSSGSGCSRTSGREGCRIASSRVWMD